MLGLHCTVFVVNYTIVWFGFITYIVFPLLFVMTLSSNVSLHETVFSFSVLFLASQILVFAGVFGD